MCALKGRELVLENMQLIVWITTVPFAILCLISCILRLYARYFIAKSFGSDDWFMLVGLFVWIGQQYLAWMWTILGGGLHANEVPEDNVFRIYVYLFVEEFWYLLLQFILKMSFLRFYCRSICATREFYNAIVAVTSLVVCQTVGTWVLYGLQCIPIQAYFYPKKYPNAKCIASDLSYYLPSVANVSMDVVIYLMPIYSLWKLQTSRRRQIELIAIFTLGGGAVIVSLLRFIVLWQLSNTNDSTYIFGSITIVTSIEFAMAIITANMPGMAAFFHSWKGESKKQVATGLPQGRVFELGNITTIGSMPKDRSYSKRILARSEQSYRRSGSEEQLNPRRRDLSPLKNATEGVRNVVIETSLEVSYQKSGHEVPRGSMRLPLDYHQHRN